MVLTAIVFLATMDNIAAATQAMPRTPEYSVSKSVKVLFLAPWMPAVLTTFVNAIQAFSLLEMNVTSRAIKFDALLMTPAAIIRTVS